MEKFMALEQKPKWNDQELIWLTKDAYCKGKIEGIREGKIKPKVQQPPRESRESHGNNRGRGRGDRGRGRGRGDRGRGRGGGGGRGGRDNNGGRKNNGIPKIGIKSNGAGIPQLKTGGTNGSATHTHTATSEPQKHGEKRKAEETPQTPETKKAKSDEPSVTSQERGEKRKAEETTPQTPETKKAKLEEPTTVTPQKQGGKRKAEEETPQTQETKKVRSEEPTTVTA